MRPTINYFEIGYLNMRCPFLGLSIVKELVAAHKETIAADSIPNQGTVFIILFPNIYC